jgi:hypothetical protein
MNLLEKRAGILPKSDIGELLIDSHYMRALKMGAISGMATLLFILAILLTFLSI